MSSKLKAYRLRMPRGGALFGGVQSSMTGARGVQSVDMVTMGWCSLGSLCNINCTTTNYEDIWKASLTLNVSVGLMKNAKSRRSEYVSGHRRVIHSPRLVPAPATVQVATWRGYNNCGVNWLERATVPRLLASGYLSILNKYRCLAAWQGKYDPPLDTDTFLPPNDFV